MAWDLGLIILESDSTEVLALIKVHVNLEHQDHRIILELKRILERDWMVKVRHVFREINQAAGYLAKWGFSVMPGFHAIRQVPHELGNILTKDCTKTCLMAGGVTAHR